MRRYITTKNKYIKRQLSHNDLELSFFDHEYTKKELIDLSSLFFKMERMMGIEPTWSAWKAEVLPLNYIRKK